MIPTLALPDSRARDLVIAAGMAAAAVTVAMTDCVLFQLAHGGAAPWLALKWMAGAVMPWAAAFVVLRTRIATEGGQPSVAEAGLLLVALATSMGLDAVLIPPADAAELGERLLDRLPLAALAPLAARLRLDWAPRRRRPAALDRRLAGARVISAAGNYVEVEGPAGRRLVRISLAEAEQRLDPARHLRIHRSTLVDASLIVQLERDRNGVAGVRLVDGRRLKVGPSYRRRVRQAIEG